MTDGNREWGIGRALAPRPIPAPLFSLSPFAFRLSLLASTDSPFPIPHSRPLCPALTSI
ncbi:hypothetical protein [Lysobacter gummosus]|uniref:hypothetical protein n=1 Tax=Lysobacter gummosus TaxID=262324 RepID=UPI003624BE51